MERHRIEVVLHQLMNSPSSVEIGKKEGLLKEKLLGIIIFMMVVFKIVCLMVLVA